MNFFTPIDRFALSPAIVLALFGCAVFLFDFLVPRTPKGQRYHLAYVVLGLGCTGWALFNQQAYLGEQHLPRLRPSAARSLSTVSRSSSTGSS